MGFSYRKPQTLNDPYSTTVLYDNMSMRLVSDLQTLHPRADTNRLGVL